MMKTQAGAFFACAGIALSLGALPAAAADPLEAYLVSIRLDELLAKGLTGAGINIGQVEFDRPRASHDVFAGQDLHIWSQSPATQDTHETGVASLLIGKRTPAGGNFQGVATGASLWYAGFNNATIAPTLIGRLKASMDWELTEPQATVVNHSWGTTTTATNATRLGVGRIIDWASSQGQTQVIAAGNDGQTAGSGGNNTGNISWPGYAYNAITVGSLQGATFDQVRAASGVSEFTGGKPTARLKVDIVAPGTDIKTASNDGNSSFTTQTGTSFATPITTGVVALLQQHGSAKGFSTDPRLMRAILMNSANKTVKNRAGTRWDDEFKADANGVTATRTSNETGAGKLDAMEAYTQYNAGRGKPSIIGSSVPGNPRVQSTGWDVNTVDGKGAANSNDYLTNAELRKGTYLTTTLTWNREVDSTDADPSKWTYSDLAGMNLGIAKKADILTLVSLSNFGTKTGGGEDETLKGTSQHNVYKTDQRSQYYIRAFLRDTSPVAKTAYALAWRGYEMDDHSVKAFNGGFDGDRGAYRDNGWYKTSGGINQAVVVRQAWMPGDANNWAMSLTGSNNLDEFDGISQEVVKPISFFKLSFDLTFDFNNAASNLQIFLGGVNVLQSFGGFLKSDSGLSHSFTHWTFELTQEQLAGLTGVGNYTDLDFIFRSGDFNQAFIDNIEYIPSAPVFAIFGVAGLFSTRRRRGA